MASQPRAPQLTVVPPPLHEDGWERAVERAIAAIAAGHMVVVSDDEDRENEGDLIMAAEKADAASLAFMVAHTSGLLCVGMAGSMVDRLRLPPMVATNTEAQGTAFTVSVDVKAGTSTGISAADRALTVRALANPTSANADFARPGHVFPLRAREGGVLKRAGHTEAAADLAELAGLQPAGVLAEIVNRDGTMASGLQLARFARRFGLERVSIADLVRYRRRRESLVTRTATATVPLRGTPFTSHVYRTAADGTEHVAMVLGEVEGKADVLVRVHSECLTGDVFASQRCDCGAQLERSIELILEAGAGVVVYLRGQEGRGIGLTHKLRAYQLQDQGLDTVDANLEQGLPVDSRDYGVGAQILSDLQVTSIRLMTNNPAKYRGLTGYGIEIRGRVPLKTTPTEHNQRYLTAKQTRLGHLLGPSDPAHDQPTPQAREET